MGVMNIFAKLVSEHTQITVLQLGIFRGVLMALGCYVHAIYSGIPIASVPSDKSGWVFGRAFFGWLSSMCSFAAIYYLPLSIAVVLYYTQPISASLANWIFNNESLSKLQIVAIFSAMLGVVMLADPGLLIPSMKD